MSTAAAIPKACACFVDAKGRLLVFDHPADGGMQLPKGTIEPGEAPEEAVRRELLEESGIRYTGELVPLGTMDRHCEAGIEGNKHRHAQLWHLFLMRAQAPLPETFEHTAHGSPEEDGLVFRFSWLAQDQEPVGFAKPYLQAIARAREAVSSLRLSSD